MSPGIAETSSITKTAFHLSVNPQIVKNAFCAALHDRHRLILEAKSKTVWVSCYKTNKKNLSTTKIKFIFVKDDTLGLFLLSGNNTRFFKTYEWDNYPHLGSCYVLGKAHNQDFHLFVQKKTQQKNHIVFNLFNRGSMHSVLLLLTCHVVRERCLFATYFKGKYYIGETKIYFLLNVAMLWVFLLLV